METYLIAHRPRRPGRKEWAIGSPGQTAITARNEDQARKEFASRFPHRAITAVGVQGVGA